MYTSVHEHARVCVCKNKHTPWKKDALDHVEVLHEHISLRLGAQVAHRVADAQLNRTSQSRRGRLWDASTERGSNVCTN